MGITYNGDSNTLTGVGSPNPVKLTLPMLDQVQDPAVQAALLRIQQFVNNLVAPSSGGGGYTSLTGPGETTTPGELVQQGPFQVFDSDTSHGILFQGTNTTVVSKSVNGANNSTLSLSPTSGTLSSTGDLFISATTLVQITSTGAASLSGATSTGIGSPSGGVTIEGHLIGIGSGASVSPQIGFFGSTPIARPMVVGSRLGNPALADLLSTLNTFGLINDGTTP